MRATHFETLHPETALAALPTTLEQTPSRAAPFLLIALAMPAAVLSLVPFAMIAIHATHDASLFAERPASSAAIGIALLAWIIVFGWPIWVRATRSSSSRCVEISHDQISVRDHGMLRANSWREPIAGYNGLAHRVRSSLSGTRHELILVHPNPDRSVLVRVAPFIGEAEVAATAALLGCPEIAPRVIYPAPVSTPRARAQQLARAA